MSFVLISGYAGIGKSSVVNELHKALVASRGFFASAEFDQYKRDTPYVPLSQAFQSLVRHLLDKSDAEVERWRHALTEARTERAVNRQPDSGSGVDHRTASRIRPSVRRRGCWITTPAARR